MSARKSCALLVALLLPACSGKQAKKDNKERQPEKVDVALFKAFHGQEHIEALTADVQKKVPVSAPISMAHFEASLIDIPIPLGATWQEEPADENVFPGLITSMAKADIVQFYHREMERLGWQEEVIFEGDTTICIFNKPNRWAAISIQTQICHSWWKSSETKNLIHIQLTQK